MQTTLKKAAMYTAAVVTLPSLSSAARPRAACAVPLATSLLGARQNALLRALPVDELSALMPYLELLPLAVGQHLFDVGDPMAYAWFPSNAIVSLQYVMEDGAITEVGVIGREGVVGAALFPSERAHCTAVVQAAGHGYRLHSERLRAAFYAGDALALQLMRHTSALLAQLAQTVAGSRHTNIEQKLCRWLLDRLDRSSDKELSVTQELIANMLGVRRESITAAAGKLQEDGLIACRRGKIMVLQRDRLAQRAGPCYLAARELAAQDAFN